MNKYDFPYEKEIDEIRAKLYQQMQELGREEFERRQAEKVQEAVKKYNLQYAVLPTVIFPA